MSKCDHCPLREVIAACHGERNPRVCTLAESRPGIVDKLEVKIPEPSLLDKAKSLAVATARHIAGGMKSVDADEKNRRLQICQTCEFFRQGVCSRCGCTCSVKAGWASEHCPIGKW